MARSSMLVLDFFLMPLLLLLLRRLHLSIQTVNVLWEYNSCSVVSSLGSTLLFNASAVLFFSQSCCLLYVTMRSICLHFPSIIFSWMFHFFSLSCLVIEVLSSFSHFRIQNSAHTELHRTKATTAATTTNLEWFYVLFICYLCAVAYLKVEWTKRISLSVCVCVRCMRCQCFCCCTNFSMPLFRIYSATCNVWHCSCAYYLNLCLSW